MTTYDRWMPPRTGGYSGGTTALTPDEMTNLKPPIGVPSSTTRRKDEMTSLPKPKTIWAEQEQLAGEPAPYGCLDCPPDIQHTTIYLMRGDSLCYTHAQIRRGQEIDREYHS